MLFGQVHIQLRLQAIFGIQKKIVRNRTFSAKKNKPLFEALGILNIYELNTYLTARFMHSYYHKKNKLPSFCDNFFLTNGNIHSYNTRVSNKIHMDLHEKEQTMANFP